MGKKGWFKIPGIELLSLVVFVIVLMFAIPAGMKGCSLIKGRGVDEEQRNRFDMLVVYINNLRVEDGEKPFLSKMEGNFQIETYGKCEKNQEPGVDCSTKPKICLRNMENKESSPYCKPVENTDLEQGILAIDKDLKLKKVEEDNKIITKIYT